MSCILIIIIEYCLIAAELGFYLNLYMYIRQTPFTNSLLFLQLTTKRTDFKFLLAGRMLICLFNFLKVWLNYFLKLLDRFADGFLQNYRKEC